MNAIWYPAPKLSTGKRKPGLVFSKQPLCFEIMKQIFSFVYTYYSHLDVGLAVQTMCAIIAEGILVTIIIAVN